jgi:hypothetical protein
MAESALPQKPETTQRLQNDADKRDMSRVVLPSRSAPIPPLSLVGRDSRHIPVQPSPKKETARIAISPHPLPPGVPARTAPRLVATSSAIDAFESIPRWFCWGLLGLSSLIFLIQIWNFALS